MTAPEHGPICGYPRQPDAPGGSGTVSAYCMAPAEHQGHHVFTARDELPVADDGWCVAKYPGDGTYGDEPCERPADHAGEHRAASDVPGSHLQRLLTWPS